MILCCGEALIDMLPGVTTDNSAAFVPHCGGAVFNTAIALGRLDVEAGLFTGLSNDLFGQMLREELRRSNVRSDLSARSGRPTTLAFVELQNGNAAYTFYDENSAGRTVSQHDLPTIPSAVSALFFGGISLVIEPAADAYLHLAEQQKASRLLMLDPNIRSGFITNEQAYRDRLSRMIAVSDILKVSDEDLAWLIPGSDTSEEKIMSLDGPVLRILTKGKKGATAFLGTTSPVTVAAETVAVIDTVGAGDTFNAGLLAFLDKRSELKREVVGTLDQNMLHAALQFAQKAASVTVSRKGANPPWRSELPPFM